MVPDPGEARKDSVWYILHHGGPHMGRPHTPTARHGNTKSRRVDVADEGCKRKYRAQHLIFGRRARGGKGETPSKTEGDSMDTE